MFRIGKLRESIFLKIILVFGLAGAAEVTILRVFQRDFLSNDLRREHRFENMAEYGRSLTTQLPPPITHDQVMEMAERLHLRIRIDGPSIHETSSPDIAEIATVDSHMTQRPLVKEKGRTKSVAIEDGTKVGRYGDFLAIDVLTSDQIHYLFLLESESALDAHPELLVLLLGGLLTILTLCFFAVRGILSPLTEIERAVKQVALGNLETEVVVKTKDELGRLGRSFNAMISRVRSMISSKEQLLLDVSHEFRSPLTRIKVAMELQGENARGSIARALKDLDTMLSELLESARLNDAQGRLRLERVDIAELLRELSRLYIDQKPGIKLYLSESSLHCLVDPTRFAIALRNLIENALKYSALQSSPVELHLSLLSENRAQITIRDHGVGIPNEDLDLIFEPFYRVDRSRVKATGGYGLGLALVQKIVIAHRGQIAVQSNSGKGSTFVIEIPSDQRPHSTHEARE